MSRLPLIACLTLFTAISVACSGVGGDRSKTTATPALDPVGAIQVEQIIDDIRSDKRSGLDKYKGRNVEVSGTVYSASWGPDKRVDGVGVAVNLPGKNVAVCIFDQKSANVALGFKKGDQVRIRGKLTGGFADKKDSVSLQLEDCEPVK